VAVKPLFALIEAHVLAAARLHGDDTTVPRLAKYKTDIARMWNYVRDDRPFGGPAPPAVVFYYSRDRKGEHPRTPLAHYTGILQVDRFAGFNDMFKSGWAKRSARFQRCEALLESVAEGKKPMTRANCWSHSRRKLFELADIDTQLKRRKADAMLIISPLALEAVQRIDRIFDIEREITGSPADVRLAVRKERVVPLVEQLEIWMREQLKTLSKHDPVAKAMRYMFNDWPGFTAFLDDGRICLTNNGAERGLRGIARGRKDWLFVGSDRGLERAAAMYTFVHMG
jgi:transposase